MLRIKRCLGIATALLFTFTLAQSLNAAEVLKVATAFPQKAFAYKGLEKLADHVKTKTNGEYELQLFPGGQLGIDREMFQQMKMGTLHFAMLTNASPVALKEGKNFNAAAAPYVFNSDEEYVKFLDTPLAKEMFDVLADNGIQYVGYLGKRSARALTTTDTLVRTPEDIKGLKIRVPGTKTIRAFFELAGASPTPLPFTELFTGLKTGVVEGQDNGIDLVEPNGFYSVQKYFMKTDHALGAVQLYASGAKWNKLPEDVKAAIIEGCAVGAETNNMMLDEYKKTAFKTLEEKGMTVVDDVDKDAFREVGEQVWAKFDGDLWDAGFMDRLQAQLKELR